MRPPDRKVCELCGHVAVADDDPQSVHRAFAEHARTHDANPIGFREVWDLTPDERAALREVMEREA